MMKIYFCHYYTKRPQEQLLITFSEFGEQNI